MRSMAILLALAITATAGDYDALRAKKWLNDTHSITVENEPEYWLRKRPNGYLVHYVTQEWYVAEADLPSEANAIAWWQAQQVAPGTKGRALVQLITALNEAGYTNVTDEASLKGKLPQIITHVQTKIDAKDQQLRDKRDEIVAHTDANQFKDAFRDQIMWDNLLMQRCQLQDRYNKVQSWAIALLKRAGEGR